MSPRIDTPQASQAGLRPGRRVGDGGRAMSETTKPLAAQRDRLPDRREHALINFTTADGFRYSAELSVGRSKRRVENNRTILFSVDLLDQLAPNAAARGISTNSLARRIVETVFDEKMIDAVLDYADGVAEYRRGAA